MSHERVKNLTEGNPLKLILNFTLPLLLGNLFQQTYNIVDSAIVGQTLGANALGSVGVSSSVQFLVLGFVTGSMTGLEQRKSPRCAAMYITVLCGRP